MKAIVYHDYGGPEMLRCEEVDTPECGDDQVLVRVRAASLNPLDRHLMRRPSRLMAKLFKLPKPSHANPGKVGRDVAGVVEAVGKAVTDFKPGDEVFGSAAGACAEFTRASDKKLVSKPRNVSFEEAASVPVVGYTALQGLRDKGHLQPGQKVLINGAAGGVGTVAVQIAKALGAEVTAVCRAANIESVRAIGADRVIDYGQEDFTQSGERYDLVFDLAWTHSAAACRRILKPNGIYIIGGGPVQAAPGRYFRRLLSALASSRFQSRKLATFMAKSNQKDLETLRDLMASGNLKPVLDSRYPLAETAEAMRRMEEGHPVGKVIVTAP
jgi:NADPH:quinone reductase-like Zn-dependent oxidoreductase